MMSEKVRKRPGPRSLFPGKLRAPVSLTLTPEHHKKLENKMRRLGLTRAELIGLLIEKYADIVELPGKGQKYGRLRDALGALGGRLERRGFGGPRGEMWTLELGGKHLPIQSDPAKTFPLLDACYVTTPGVVLSRTDDTGEIDPAGLAQLFARLAAS
jgi:hypothetical protein